MAFFNALLQHRLGRDQNNYIYRNTISLIGSLLVFIYLYFYRMYVWVSQVKCFFFLLLFYLRCIFIYVLHCIHGKHEVHLK